MYLSYGTAKEMSICEWGAVSAPAVLASQEAEALRG